MENRKSLGCIRIFALDEEELAETFFHRTGQRDDVASCLKYFDSKANQYIVEWTYKKN